MEAVQNHRQTIPRPIGRRRRNAIDRRGEILDGAASVFMEQGFGGASMDAIAAASGVSKMTLYRYFESKEVLFEALVETMCDRILAVGSEQPIFTQPPEAALPQIARLFLETVNQPDTIGLLRIVIAEAHRFPSLGRLFYEAGPRKNVDALAAYFEKHRNHPSLAIEDPRGAAESFFSIARGYTQLRMMLGVDEPRDGLPVDDRIRQIVSPFLRA